jgi:bifunctional non-homologous end joining protein LigD
MFGKKLKGEFALVKLKSKDDNTWLLIKHNDEYATNKDYNSETDTPKNSPINKWLAENKPEKLVTLSQKPAAKESSAIKKKVS